jgi:hypothetical protein
VHTLCPAEVYADAQKCTLCSAEITFKTDPKNADYICEHGATRNFENWAETDSKRGVMPGAEADDEYDSEGNALEDKAERDAMADLERSQEQSRREMDMMDELADLRQRNARMETSGAGDELVAKLHMEKVTAEEEARRAAEEEEDDREVAKHFSKASGSGEVIKRAEGRASVASILAAKGKTLEPAAGVKRKREGMQKLLGIKKKA